MHSVLALIVLAVAVPALTAAATATAEPACAPRFGVVRPDPVSVETVTLIEATADGAERVEVEWGDGARSVEPVSRGGGVVAYHRYSSSGLVEVVATAVCAGETRGPSVRVRVDVLPPCARRRDASVTASDCDDARGSLVVSDVGGQASATWVDAPCRDTGSIEIVRPPGDAPRARAADCVASVGRSVVGPLYTRPGAAVRLTFGAPAQRVVVRTGSPARGVLRVGDARRVNRTGRAWRIRLPSPTSRRLTRLYVVAFRPGEVDHYFIHLRLPRR